MRQELLRPNPAGPFRFFRRLDPDGVEPLVEELTQRLETKLALTAKRDETLGRVCSYIEPNGRDLAVIFIDLHLTRIHPRAQGQVWLRWGDRRPFQMLRLFKEL